VSVESELAVTTSGLRKQFGRQVAVRNLSLSVPRGEIFGFLGPNGAGKSTSIKMLLGLVHPTAGHALVLGAPPTNVAMRQRIGFLPEDFRFYDWLTAVELLLFHGRLAGMTSSALARRVPEVLELVGLTGDADRRLRGFSKGMLQRIGLAQALIHEPDLLFLDEPTSGLDPMGRRMVRDILRRERERGTTIFLNSHLLSEIEITCDRVAFLKNGAVVAERALGRAEGEARVAIRARNLPADIDTRVGPPLVDAILDGETLRFAVSGVEQIPPVVRWLVESGADVFEVTRERVSLEELFVGIMGEAVEA
jgi:ABC-2 type transport system ATP-binding protein